MLAIAMASNRTLSRGAAQIDFIVELAAAGLGGAFLPQMIAQQRKHASVSRVLLAEPDTDWHIAMVWRRGA